MRIWPSGSPAGPGRRRAPTHLLGLTVDEDWSALGAQRAGLPAPALVVLDGEAEITALAGQLWPDTPIQRCWWHLPHGLRKALLHRRCSPTALSTPGGPDT
ncbi:MAG TPA: hypothetical protein VFQ77_09830 [Pseudonocardiaceae bacterium]|nr:hypothetical protein [Pseudonocardiaceae bacterium]